MTRTSKMLCAASTVALVAFGASPALAQVVTPGTTAGTAIQNTATVTFNVGGEAQDAQTSNTDEFLVDRKVDLIIEEVDGAATLVSPGGIQQITTFDVTNLSNSTIDINLLLAQQAGGAGEFGGTDNFNTNGPRFFIDRNNDGTFEEVTFLDEILANETIQVQVRTNVPLTRDGTAPLQTGDVASVVLTGRAHAAGATGLGAILNNTPTNTANLVDNVLADGSGTTDADNDGAFSARDDYLVSAAALSVLKSSRIVDDFVSADNFKAIPGALVEYCIAVTNAAGSANATDITVSDILPDNVEFVLNSIRLNGTVDASGTCQTDGTAGGAFDGTTVSGDLDPLSPTATDDATLTLIFQATID